MPDTPAKVKVPPRPKQLPETSHRSWITFQILHAPTTQIALRYFQSLDVLQALYIYGQIQGSWTDFKDMAVHPQGLTYEDLYTLLRDYLALCLTQGWHQWPI